MFVMAQMPLLHRLHSTLAYHFRRRVVFFLAVESSQPFAEELVDFLLGWPFLRSRTRRLLLQAWYGRMRKRSAGASLIIVGGRKEGKLDDSCGQIDSTNSSWIS